MAMANPKIDGKMNRQADIENEQAAANSTVTETSPEFNQFQFYDNFINSQNGYKPEDEQERKAREKRERTNKIIAGVGDMISALANMYYTTKGAPNSFDPKEGLTPKMQARYDMLQKEREARDKEYRSGLERARQLDWQRNLSWQQLQAQRERWRAQDEERKQKAEQLKAQAEEKKKAEDQKNQYTSLAIQFKDDPYRAAYYHALSQGRTQEQAELEGQAVQASYNAKQAEKNRKAAAQAAKKNNKNQKQTSVPSMFVGMKGKNQ